MKNLANKILNMLIFKNSDGWLYLQSTEADIQTWVRGETLYFLYILCLRNFGGKMCTLYKELPTIARLFIPKVEQNSVDNDYYLYTQLNNTQTGTVPLYMLILKCLLTKLTFRI